MTHGERYVEALTFGKPDRPPHWFMFGLMPGVYDRWVSEGMPEFAYFVQRVKEYMVQP
jgi:hypothetical protein